MATECVAVYDTILRSSGKSTLPPTCMFYSPGCDFDSHSKNMHVALIAGSKSVVTTTVPASIRYHMSRP